VEIRELNVQIEGMIVDLMESAEVVDTHAKVKATEAYDKLAKFVEFGLKKIVKDSPAGQMGEIDFKDLKFPPGLLVSYNPKGMFEYCVEGEKVGYPDIRICLEDRDKLSGQAGGEAEFVVKEMKIHLYIIRPRRELKGKENPVYTQKDLKMVLSELKKLSTKRDFVHEFTHYLDLLRFKGADPVAYDEKGERDVMGGWAQYINDPWEFDAYFEEGLFRIEEFLSKHFEKMGIPSQRNKEMSYLDSILGRGFQEFYKWIKKMGFFSYEFIKYLDSKYRKHFYKRLYEFHNEMINQYKIEKNRTR